MSLKSNNYCEAPFGSPSVSLGSRVMTQGFCTYISSFLVISSPAALYGLSHHSLADLLPAFLRVVFRYHAPL